MSRVGREKRRPPDREHQGPLEDKVAAVSGLAEAMEEPFQDKVLQDLVERPALRLG